MGRADYMMIVVFLLKFRGKKNKNFVLYLCRYGNIRTNKVKI